MTAARLLLVVAWMFQAPAARDAQPLPDQQTFLSAVRQNLTRSQDAEKAFAYKERRTDLDFNPFGHVGTGGTRLVEVMPSADGATVTRRTIERDGKPVTSSPTTRHVNPMPQGTSVVDDVVAALDVKMDHREIVEGRRMIVLAFTPLPDAKPRTREGRLVRAFKGQIWIDEEAKEVARIEARSIDDVSFGYGVFGRLNDGATVTVRRQPIDGTLWLPVSVRFKGEGRALLFRKLVIDFALDWFDYRRVYSSSSPAS